MEYVNKLTRNEMKNMIAGSEPCEGNCLFCTTPFGIEAWSSSGKPENLDEECQLMYPEYPNVEGSYSDCDTGQQNDVTYHCN